MACILLVPKGPLVLLVESTFLCEAGLGPLVPFYPQPANGVVEAFVPSFSSDVGQQDGWIA